MFDPSLSVLGFGLTVSFGLLLRQVSVTPIGWFVGLPATMLHELAHWFLALVFGCRPSPIRLHFRKSGTKTFLGSVEFEARRWCAGLIALAPLAWLMAATTTWIFDPEPSGPLEMALTVLACAYFFCAGIPSRADWRIALLYPAGPAVLFTIAGAIVAQFVIFAN